MDEQAIAHTIGELERKLGELERTLHAMSAPRQEAQTEQTEQAEQPQQAAQNEQAAQTVSRDGIEPVAEPARSSTSSANAAVAPRRGFGRIIDESVEPVHPQEAAAAAPPQAPPLARPAPAARTAPPPPTSAQPQRLGIRRPTAPGPAELLRFRERLERAARDLTHDYDELLGRLSYAAMPTSTGPTISFARGVPSLDIIDVDGLKEAAVRAFESDPEGTTAYGTAVGYPRLRAWIADKHGVEPERVLVTNGSLQADAFLFDHLVGDGDEVVVESPTYDRTLLGLRQRGARLHPVALEQDGIDTGALAALLDGGARPKLAHIIPNFQNPAGYTLSLRKREELLELAGRHDFIVLEDDPYGELRFTGEQVPTMLSLDGSHVVYASSFTKTIAPGVRVGYLVGPPDLIAALTKRATNTYISPNMVSESLVYEFCASGKITGSIETVKRALAERSSALAQALRRELPEAEFVEPEGGYFLWVTLPEGTDVARLFDAAAERGVAFVKGTDFLLEGGENTLRLAYSGVTTEEVETGVQRLAEAYRSL